MIETTGVSLKRKLGLSHMKYVYISRVIISVHKIYFIFYDSRRPNFPITTHRALKGEYTSMMFRYPFDKAPVMLPLIPLENFNGVLETGLFFTVDISGQYGDPLNKVNLEREKVVESVEEARLSFFRSIDNFLIQEYLTFKDLNYPSNISDFTKRTRGVRNQALGTENKLAKLLDVNIDTVEDHVTFIFRTQATTPIYPDDYKFKKTKTSDFSLTQNKDKQYDLYFRILNFFEWLKGTNPDGRAITGQDVKDVLKVNNVQVFSTSPSFHWQGFNYWMSQLDASIYPTDIAPKVWDKVHGDGEAFLDKHLYGLIRQINFFLNPMASMLTKRLKDRELL